LVDEVHFLGAYENIDFDSSHKKTKDEICVRLGADYLIDDQPKHVLSAYKAGVGAILFGDYGWNRNVLVDDGVKRARNWDEVYRIVMAEEIDGRTSLSF
jgi:5'(3')-deoxyribonucleotidase